jgi:hypothetical protein
MWYVLNLGYPMPAHDLSSDFMDAGVTPLDRLCFDTQHDRQCLELSVVIPQLKSRSSASQHPPKRTKS